MDTDWKTIKDGNDEYILTFVDETYFYSSQSKYSYVHRKILLYLEMFFSTD